MKFLSLTLFSFNSNRYESDQTFMGQLITKNYVNEAIRNYTNLDYVKR